MASRLFSNYKSGKDLGPSIYEEMKAAEGQVEHVEHVVLVDEHRAIDEENLAAQYHDYDYDNAFPDDHESATESHAFLSPKPAAQKQSSPLSKRRQKSVGREKWMSRSPRMLGDDIDDGDVPASLLIEEEDEVAGPSRPIEQHTHPRRQRTAPPAKRHQAQGRQAPNPSWAKIHEDDDIRPTLPVAGSAMSPREIALWQWSQVENLSRYLGEVYDYFQKGGIYCICLARLFQKLTILFIVITSTYLWQCINYKKIHLSTSLHEVVVPKCMSRVHGMPIFIIWCLCFWTIYQTAHDVLDIVRLRRMRNFYQHLLHVPDTDIQTIEWRDVIARLMDLKDLNPNVDDKKRSPLVKEFMGRQSKAKLDAHDVAHRLMRKENYMIAMFNKEIIDLSIPYKVPFVEIAAKQLTRPMVLWCLNFVIMDFFFDKNGHLNPMVLDLKQRKRLIAALRARFTFIGTIAFMACPFVFVYTFILCFYQNFTEFQKNATAMGARRYTPWAQLQFREFNELPHLFNHRLNMSHPFASRYLEQFPKRKTAEIARFVTLVLGGLLAILGVGFIIFSEAHLVDFEITEGYSVLWYVTIIGAAWGVARGMIPDETDVFFPEYVLRQVIQYIRYMPAEWKGRLHSDEVRAEFQEMYELRLVSFVWELAATVLTGFICFGGLQKSSERIVDFFHDNTVHVEGLGHVCSYAVFDFEKGPRGPKTGAGRADVGGLNMADNELDDFYLSKHGKMAASYFGFLDNYAANPKGLGHVPPAMSPELHQQNFGFQPPPAWPGMHGMANTGIMDMARSRPALARSVIPGQTARRQPMASSGVFDHGISPVSNLPPLPHESSFATGTRKSIYNPARSRFHTRNVVEDFDEEAEIGLDDRQDKGKGRMGESRFGPVPEASMLDWETGARNSKTEEDAGPDPEAQLGGEGVLGMLMQVKRAGTSNRPGVNL